MSFRKHSELTWRWDRGYRGRLLPAPMTFTAQVCRLLSAWITFLLAAVPPRSRRTFIDVKRSKTVTPKMCESLDIPRELGMTRFGGRLCS
jgi:hypothetical protein